MNSACDCSKEKLGFQRTSAAKHRYLSDGCYTGVSDRLIPGQTWGRRASLPESDSPVDVSDFTSDHAVLSYHPPNTIRHSEIDRS